MKYILTSLFFIALLILAGCTDKEENRGEPVVSTEEEVTESLAEAPEAEDEEESLYSEEEHGEPLKIAISTTKKHYCHTLVNKLNTLEYGGNSDQIKRSMN